MTINSFNSKGFFTEKGFGNIVLDSFEEFLDLIPGISNVPPVHGA